MANNLEFLCRVFFTHTPYPPGQSVFLTFTECTLYFLSIVVKHLNIGKGAICNVWFLDFDNKANVDLIFLECTSHLLNIAL